MQTLKVKITLEMTVPDGWNVVQTADGVDVLRIAEGQYMDLTFEPLLASNPEETWTSSDSDDFLNELLDMVESEDVEYELSAQ